MEDLDLPISQEQWDRYYLLIARRDAELLTPAEHEELIRISDTIEEANAILLGRLVELAKQRQVSLEELMEELGIKPRNSQSL